MSRESIDYKTLFSKTLYEEMVRAFGEHGIDVITEDELDDIVAECLRKVYWPSIAEFNRLLGRPKGRAEFKLPPPRLIRINQR